MKKLALGLLIAALALTACVNSEKKEVKQDSTVVAPVDTTILVDSTKKDVKVEKKETKELVKKIETSVKK